MNNHDDSITEHMKNPTVSSQEDQRDSREQEIKAERLLSGVCIDCGSDERLWHEFLHLCYDCWFGYVLMRSAADPDSQTYKEEISLNPIIRKKPRT